MNMNIRTRFAPSPTGRLHIGGARTALFNFLFAKNQSGIFILRIEDTDIERSEAHFEKEIIESLSWLDIQWDEDPYYQSERISIYKTHLEKLLEKGGAFWCSHSEEELGKEREMQIQAKETLRHVCEFRNRGLTEGEIIRFKNDEAATIKFHDLIRGEISFEPALLGDFSLAKNLHLPLYNFAVTVDDYEMEISHVIRGEDHISNTPKQILIQKALEFTEPKYAHLPLILGKDRSKLSKRHGAVAIHEYRQEGYLKEALVNFMALLGWHPTGEKELFSLEELFKVFSLGRIQKSGAVFDIEKLNWLNKEYIKKMPSSELAKKINEHLPKEWTEKKNHSFLEKIINLEKTRIIKLSDLKENAEYFFKKPIYPKSLLKYKAEQNFEEIEIHLDKLIEILQKIMPENFSREDIVKVTMPYAEEKGRGEVLWPLRVSLTGKKASPGPFEIAEILGKEKVIDRLRRAKKIIKE